MTRSFAESSAQSRLPRLAGEPSPLHPVLQTALTNLDVQLEEELIRYRRERNASHSTPRSAKRKSAGTLDLIAVPAAGASAKAPTASAVTATLTPPIASVVPATAASHAFQGITELPTNAVQPHSAPKEIAPSSALITTEAASEAEPDPSPLVSTPRVASAEPPASEPPLDDYLESSEALLRSLAEEEAQIQAERGFMKSLLTPMGVGSMLLLLLSSAMFGFVVMNPASLEPLLALRNGKSAPAPVPVPSTSTAPSAVPTSPGNTPQPNLAAKEFDRLNITTLGTQPASRTGTTVTPPNPTDKSKTETSKSPSANSQPAPPAGVTRPAETVPSAPAAAPTQAAPAPVRSQPVPRSQPSAPRPAPAPAPPAVRAPSPVSAPPADRSYKLESDYTGDAALNEAKKVVPDTFLTNTDEGAKIQLGAYSNASEAEARAQQLRKQGISVQVKKR